ncbi:MAG: dynamin family protein [Pseudomonadota bacterium]
MEASTSAISSQQALQLASVIAAFETASKIGLPDDIVSVRAGFERLSRKLTNPVRIAFLGETNVGKTTLANRMLGSAVLPTSVVANTPYRVHLRHGPVPSVTVHTKNGAIETHVGADIPKIDSQSIEKLEIALPLPQLRDIEILDTPGQQPSGSGARQQMIPADIWVWCTNSSRAWSASDRTARMNLPPIPRARAILVATQADTLRGDVARSAVFQRLAQETSEYFGTICFSSLITDNMTDFETGARARSEADVSFEKSVFQCIRQFRHHKLRGTQRLSRRLATLAITAVEHHYPIGNSDRGSIEPLLQALGKLTAREHNEQSLAD